MGQYILTVDKYVMPDQTFDNFLTSKSVDRQISSCSDSTIEIFCGLWNWEKAWSGEEDVGTAAASPQSRREDTHTQVSCCQIQKLPGYK